MARRITITYDLEDHRPRPDLPLRYPEMTDRLLAFLAERSIRASVFAVGSLAEAAPGRFALHSYKRFN